MSLSRSFNGVGRQVDSARVVSQRVSSSSVRRIAMKTTIFALLLAVALSACAPAATPAATLAPAPTTAPVAAPTAGSVGGTFAPDVRPPASGGGVTPPTLAPKHAASQPDSIKPLQGWQQLGSIKVPAARSDHVLIATGSFNRLVLFGGRSAGAAFKDTWIYDLAANAWHQVTSSIAPDARYGAGAAYDAASQRVLIFGGQAGTKFFNDVWSFDVVSEQWGQIKTAGIAPAARSGTAAAIDPELHQLIISQGAAAAGLTDDTWTLDLGTKVWQNILPGTRPTARSQNANIATTTTASPYQVMAYCRCSLRRFGFKAPVWGSPPGGCGLSNSTKNGATAPQPLSHPLAVKYLVRNPALRSTWVRVYLPPVPLSSSHVWI